jgi:hypothetical protein
MNNPEQQSQSENYLERTRQVAERESVLLPEEFNSTVEELSTRLTQDQWQNEGVMAFNLPHVEGEAPAVCTIGYDSSLDRKFKKHVLGEEFDETIVALSRYKKIKGFTVERGDDRLDLKDVLEQCSVYIYPHDVSSLTPQEKMELGASADSGFVMSEFDPSSPIGLFFLLHEMGHFVEDSSISEDEKIDRIMARSKRKLGGVLNEDERACIVKDERNASAFFVKNMRKFLDTDTLEKINKIGVQRGVKSYYDNLK